MCVVEKIEVINRFRNSNLFEDKQIEECFLSGKGMRRIFVKHIARAWDFPILDRYV